MDWIAVFLNKKFSVLFMSLSFVAGLVAGGLVVYYSEVTSLLPPQDIKSNLKISNSDTEEVVQEFFAVDLSGAVKNPGVYKLNNDSRLVDVIQMGGGVLTTASGKWVSQNLNLSKKITDEAKIYVPFEWELSSGACDDLTLIVTPYQETMQSSPSTGSGTPASDIVNVNTASQDEIESLAGIGETYAVRIISKRPYKDLIELKEKANIPQSTVDKFASQIRF